MREERQCVGQTYVTAGNFQASLSCTALLVTRHGGADKNRAGRAPRPQRFRLLLGLARKGMGLE